LKLDAGNPNLMKKAAMRVNPYMTLESFGNAGDKGQANMRKGYVPPVRDPDVVPPATNSLWAQPVYASPKNEYIRPGAEDHLKYKSRGF